jgi:hypothetical protein
MTTSAVAPTSTLALRLPWATVATSAAVGGFVILRALALPGSELSPLTVRLLELALAGGAAYAFDDAAAGLTSVVPRSLWRRRVLSLGTGLTAIAVAWTVMLLDLRPAAAAPMRSLTLELIVLVLLVLATSAVLVRRGEDEPGSLVAVTVPLTGVAALTLGGLVGFDVFIGEAVRTPKGAAWAICGLVALALMAAAGRDAAARPVLGRPRGYRGP